MTNSSMTYWRCQCGMDVPMGCAHNCSPYAAAVPDPGPNAPQSLIDLMQAQIGDLTARLTAAEAERDQAAAEVADAKIQWSGYIDELEASNASLQEQVVRLQAIEAAALEVNHRPCDIDRRWCCAHAESVPCPYAELTAALATPPSPKDGEG